VTTLASRDLEQHLEGFGRGAVDLIDEETLTARLRDALAADRGLRVKFGMDPSSADLHVGHAVQLRKLRTLQDLGHTIVLIVGDATAMVGDPSGRNKLRPQLTREEVERNLATYTAQAGIVLDMERTEVRRNSEWFDAMAFQDVLRLASRMTVAQMIQRETFQERMKAEAPIGIHEFLYPLMQGWDSVVIDADVELGGTDQLFNLLVGRDLQEQEGKPPQVVMTMPLINGLDGRKMSKSYGNAIGLTEQPNEVFGRVMALVDDEMPTWFEVLTDLGAEERAALQAGHPRDAKHRLALLLTEWLHDAEQAGAAADDFDRRFRQKALPTDVPEVPYDGDWPDDGLPLNQLVRAVFELKSSSEARRLITQGGVRVDGEVVSDPLAPVAPPSAPLLLQVGKRRVAHVVRPG
jgi:tyrosyl-tRNA synthetase